MIKPEKKISSSFLSTSLSVAVITFGIKIMGFVKQMIIASVYGANAETDAFFLVTSILVALGSVFFSAITITLLSRYSAVLIREGEKQANRLIDSVLKIFLPVSVLLTVCFILLAPWISTVLAPSYTGEQRDIVITYIRWMSVYFIFCCFYLVLNVVAEANRQFIIGKGYSFFQNIFIILAAVLFSKQFGIQAMVWAFLIAAAAQCAATAFVVRNSYQFHPKTSIRKDEVKKILVTAAPLLVGNAIYEINDIVDKRIASGLSAGAVSHLHYGASLNEVVVSVVITSVSTILFAYFAVWVAQGKLEQMTKSVVDTSEVLIAFLLPVTAFTIIQREEIVSLVFGRGAFGADDLVSTGAVLAGYAVGFLFQSFRAIYVKVFYANGDTRTPMLNGAVAVALNIVLSVTLSQIWGVGAVALSTSISMAFVSLLLSVQSKKYLPNISILNLIPETAKAVAATLIMCVGVRFLLRYFVLENTLLCLLVSGLVSLLVYLFMMVLFRANILAKLKNLIHF